MTGSKSTPAHRGLWSSRMAFILAATGSAVGLGNIWKFPYVTGENGGGAFVLVYLLCIAIVGIPIMMAEVYIGRSGRHNPITSFRLVAERNLASPVWRISAIVGVLAAFIILSFYSVIGGWAASYVGHAAMGDFTGQSADAIGELFGGLLASPVTLLIWHTIFMALVIFVVARGLKSGLERAVTILMPALFVLLLVAVGYATTTGHFGAAVAFLFTPDFGALTMDGVLVALGHAFFTLSLGMAIMMAYGSYLGDECVGRADCSDRVHHGYRGGADGRPGDFPGGLCQWPGSRCGPRPDFPDPAIGLRPDADGQHIWCPVLCAAVVRGLDLRYFTAGASG